MPDIEIQPVDEGQPDLGEEGTAQEPKKITIPGLEGEYTAEEIASWKGNSDNIGDWRRELNDRGAAINEARREIDEIKSSLADRERRLNDIEHRVSQPQQPTRDWRTIEDPAEQQKAFFDEFARKTDERFDRLEARDKKFEETLTAREKKEREVAEMQTFQNLAESAIAKSMPEDFPEGDDYNKVLMAIMGIELYPIDKRNWNEETFNRAARNGYGLLEKFGKAKVEQLIKQKKKGAEVKTAQPSSPPAPEAKNRLTAKMDKAARMKIYNADPNLK